MGCATSATESSWSTGDMRAMDNSVFEDVAAVINLGGLSNDPTAEFNPDANYQMNTVATEVSAKQAKQAGVQRYIFASSCSIYDQGVEDPDADLILDESSEVLAARRLLELQVRGRAAPAAADRPEFLPGRPAQGHRVRLVAAHALRPRREHVPEGRADARPHHHPLRRRDVAADGRGARCGAGVHRLRRGRRGQGARPDLQRHRSATCASRSWPCG